MRRLLTILLLSASPLFAQTSSRLPISGVAGATTSAGSSISVVQHQHSNTSANCNAVTTCAVTFTSSVGAGHLLVYLTAAEVGSGLNACTDTTGGSALNTIATALNVNLASGSQRISYVANSNSGSTTVTCTTTAAANIHLHLWEISGTVTGTPLDLTKTGTQAATSQSLSTTTATNFANEIVFGLFYDRPNNDSLTAGTGFSPSDFIDGGSGNESSLSEVKIVSSTGTQTITATCGSGTNTVAQLLATFHA